MAPDRPPEERRTGSQKGDHARRQDQLTTTSLLIMVARLCYLFLPAKWRKSSSVSAHTRLCIKAGGSLAVVAVCAALRPRTMKDALTRRVGDGIAADQGATLVNKQAKQSIL
jgi:hypothetical protein